MTRRTNPPTSRQPVDRTEAREDALGSPSMTRRDFVLAACAGMGAVTVPRMAGARVPNSQPATTMIRGPQPIGLQLYTVRDLMEENFEYALRQVAEIGYREVEFAGLFGKEPKKVATMLGKMGLTAPSSHIPLDRLRTGLPGVVDEAQTLGNQYVVCPSIDGSLQKDAAGWRRAAADLNRAGDSLQRVGLRLAYHNHDVEFHPLPSGEIGYDILLAECDPKFVKMELDLYWITKGGRDPLEYFAKWPSRFPLVHVKDMAGNGAMTAVGQGHIDWGRIFAKRRDAGIEHFYVEYDDTRSPIADITVSYDYMKRLDL